VLAPHRPITTPRALSSWEIVFPPLLARFDSPVR